MGGSTKVVPVNSNTQQTVEVPQYIKDAGISATAKAQEFANKPYEKYSGELVAGLTANQKDASAKAGADQNAGRGGITNAYGALAQGNAALGQGQGALSRAGDVAASTAGAGFDSANYSAALARLAGITANDNKNAGAADLDQARGYNTKAASNITGQDISGYFNPFVQQALDPVIGNLTRASGQQDAKIRSGAAMSDSFGGSRSTLRQTQNQADLLRQIATTSSAGYSDAYDKALAAMQNQRAREATASGQSLNIGLGANTTANDSVSRYTQSADSAGRAGAVQSSVANDTQNRFLSLIDPSMKLASGYGANAEGYRNTGMAESQLSTEAINRLLTTGALDQAQQQNINNANYQQWQNEQDYSLKQINALIAAAGGVPYSTATDSKTQGQQIVQTPSMFGQIAGALGSVAGAAIASDRDAKTDFAPVDDEDVLSKFRKLGVEEYRYVPEARDAVGDDGRKRIGPMAQDWAKHFGGDGKVIPMPNIVGELVSAVKALERRTDKLAA